MTGCLQTKSGKFYVVLSFKNEMGKRQQKWINTGLAVKDNKRKAELFLKKTISEYSNGNITPHKNILFVDFMYHWLETIENFVEPNTHSSYCSTVTNYIKPHFTETQVKLQSLKPADIQTFYNKQLKKGLSATTVLNQHANIRKALQHAVRMNVIAYNPADRVTLPKKQKYKANYYTKEQISTMLEVFREEDMYAVVLLASFLGLRRSEVLGLKWKHIDFTANTLIIEDVVVSCSNKVFIDKSRTKTKSSRRTLPLPLSVSEFLQKLKLQQEENEKLLGKGYVRNDYVCKWGNGEPFNPGYISRRFNKVLAKNSLPSIRFHDLRHSAASMLLENHSLKEIQEWLGHGDLATTADIYAHLQFQSKRNMANSLDEKIKL